MLNSLQFSCSLTSFNRNLTDGGSQGALQPGDSGPSPAFVEHQANEDAIEVAYVAQGTTGTNVDGTVDVAALLDTAASVPRTNWCSQWIGPIEAWLSGCTPQPGQFLIYSLLLQMPPGLGDVYQAQIVNSGCDPIANLCLTEQDRNNAALAALVSAGVIPTIANLRFSSYGSAAAQLAGRISTGADQSWFWAGGTGAARSKAVVEDFASHYGGITLATALKQAGIETAGASDQFWIDASKAWAMQASGNVRVVLGETVTETSHFLRYELDILLDNPSVTSINVYDPRSGDLKWIFQR